MTHNDLLQNYLSRTFTAKKRRNPSYSLRSFSRDLGVNAATLSQVMSGKRNLSKLNAQKVAEKLAIGPLHKQVLLATGTQVSQESSQWVQIADDEFRLMSEWYYIACLNLAKLPQAKSDPAWIARRLNITVDEAREAINGLTRLGFLETRGKLMYRVAKNLTTQNDIPSAAIRNYHKQNLTLASEAIEAFDISLRDLSSITVPIDLASLPDAKRLIQEFKKCMSELLQKGTPTEVYTCAVQLFPVTNPQEEQKV